MERPDTQQDQMSTDPPVEARDSKPQSVPGSTQIDRKILGEKNVNTDPIVSPKKLTKSAPLDGKLDKPDFKKPLLPFKDSTRNRIRDRKSRTVAAEPPSLNVPPPDHVPEIVQTIELPLEPEMSALPPKTPAGLDLFSPTSTDASTSCPPTEGRDTPPPSGLGESSHARGGRRRAAVSYAEPKLNTKMRRPGKELVGAVEGLSKGTAIKIDDSKSEGEKDRPKEIRTVVIKREPQEDGDSAWKNMPIAKQNEDPASPLSKKTGSAVPRAEAPLTDITAVSSEPDAATAADAPDKSSASSATLSALISGSGAAAAARKRPDKPISATLSQAVPTEDKHASLAIFEFESSSPSTETSTVATAGSTASDRAKARAGRRHSSISSLRPSTGESKEGVGAREGKERAVPPPRSRTLKELRQAELDARGQDLKQGQRIGSADADGDAGAGAVAAPAATMGRLERAASRRRSMML